MNGFTAVFDLETPDRGDVINAVDEAFDKAELVGGMSLTSLEVGRSPANQQWMLVAAFDTGATQGVARASDTSYRAEAVTE